MALWLTLNHACALKRLEFQFKDDVPRTLEVLSYQAISDFKLLATPWHPFFPRTTFGFLYAILI